jgi:hypothetical protein
VKKKRKRGGRELGRFFEKYLYSILSPLRPEILLLDYGLEYPEETLIFRANA